ncbi:hypothetical protein A5881_003049 [Enterococcus termitis]|nr:hypothetical protein A5881_002303 [Enterococcus termitis]
MNKSDIIIEFPLRGEWHTPTTPAKKIPSHGTNRMGMRYAFDFLQINWQDKGKAFHDVSDLHYIFSGVSIEKYYCYNQDIFAPCDGEIVAVVDGIPERKIVNWLVDMAIGIKNSATFNERKDHFSQIAGNYIIMKLGDDLYAAFAHLKTDSIIVSINDRVKKGSLLGKVGHSGNSTSPHLHFQLMDRDDITNAKGVPFRFEQYELYIDNQWKTVFNQIPSASDRFRFCKD